ncbi:MAG TPA: hypothetical protein PK886_02735 [Candidatus Paceibacterota bacterium]|nr:hypothetical protein [Candidatus Paceibacterota bacterium]
MENRYQIGKLLSELQSAKDELRDFLEDNRKDLNVLWFAIQDYKDDPSYKKYALRYKELITKSNWNFSDPMWNDETLGDLAKEIPDVHRKVFHQWIEKNSRIRSISLDLMFFGFEHDNIS